MVAMKLARGYFKSIIVAVGKVVSVAAILTGGRKPAAIS